MTTSSPQESHQRVLKPFWPRKWHTGRRPSGRWGGGGGTRNDRYSVVRLHSIMVRAYAVDGSPASFPHKSDFRDQAHVDTPYNITERTALVNRRILPSRWPPTFGINPDRAAMTRLASARQGAPYHVLLLSCMAPKHLRIAHSCIDPGFSTSGQPAHSGP